jgi:hypothetical protein
MLARASSRPRNRLLAALSQADLNLLRPHLEPVQLKIRLQLEPPNRPINEVYFRRWASRQWWRCNPTKRKSRLD